MRKTAATAVMLFLAGAVLLAADISGVWKGRLEQSDREITFTFQVSGEKLTGTVAGLRDKAVDVQDGKVQGDTVTFFVMSEWQGEPVKLVYKGQAAGGEIRFTMGTEDGGWSTEVVAKR